MNEALLGFLSGVGVTLVGAYVANLLQRMEERRRRVRENQIQIYFKLLGLYNHYFWVASLEMHGEEVDSEQKKRIRNLAWQISDLIRTEDTVPHAEEILRVLMSNEYPSASNRHDAMGELLDKVGKIVNPAFQSVSKALSNENIMRVGTGLRSDRQGTQRRIDRRGYRVMAKRNVTFSWCGRAASAVPSLTAVLARRTAIRWLCAITDAFRGYIREAP